MGDDVDCDEAGLDGAPGRVKVLAVVVAPACRQQQTVIRVSAGMHALGLHAGLEDIRAVVHAGLGGPKVPRDAIALGGDTPRARKSAKTSPMVSRAKKAPNPAMRPYPAPCYTDRQAMVTHSVCTQVPLNSTIPWRDGRHTVQQGKTPCVCCTLESEPGAG